MTAQPGTPALRIRPATIADSGAIANLCGQLSYPSTTEEVVARLDGIAKIDEHAVFIAEQPDGSVAGWVHVFVMRVVEADARAEVGGLVVDESCRSQGVGALLLGHVEQWSREKGCKTIGLRSNVIRERAHQFYERLGYKAIKTQKSFRKQL